MRSRVDPGRRPPDGAGAAHLTGAPQDERPPRASAPARLAPQDVVDIGALRGSTSIPTILAAARRKFSSTVSPADNQRRIEFHLGGAGSPDRACVRFWRKILATSRSASRPGSWTDSADAAPAADLLRQLVGVVADPGPERPRRRGTVRRRRAVTGPARALLAVDLADLTPRPRCDVLDLVVAGAASSRAASSPRGPAGRGAPRRRTRRRRAFDAAGFLLLGCRGSLTGSCIFLLPRSSPAALRCALPRLPASSAAP